jgi:eukaryotic-like serine/threonine-protein kinase
MARPSRTLTSDVLQEEIRFLLRTLLRDDLFGEQVSLTEAEKLLEASLSIGFVEYCAFLKRHAYVDVDRGRNTIAVLPRGKHIAEGGTDPQLGPYLAAHFQKQIDAGRPLNVEIRRDETPRREPTPLPRAAAAINRTPDTEHVPREKDRRPQEPTEPPGGDIERYVRGDELGRGSLGVVVRAKDSVLDRDVVLKEVRHVFELVSYLPREEIIKRVRDAIMTQGKLDHPHVLRVVDVDFGAQAPTLVLEYAVGGSLRARMTRALPPVEVALRVVLQASTALAFAHAKGITHGGLKPENVLFDAAGNVRLADFGLARATERAPDPTTSAPPVYVGRGSTSYMSPEHLHKGELTQQGDIYAVGIMLYELLCGTLPGRRSPMPSASPRVAEKLGEAATAIDDLFDRMTRDPLNERIASFDDVIAMLYAALPQKNVVGRGTLLLYEKDWDPTMAVAFSSLESLPSADGEPLEITDPGVASKA